jgi:hypothetical protein
VISEGWITLDWGREKVHLASGRRRVFSGFEVEEALCGYVVGSTPKEGIAGSVDEDYICKRCLKRTEKQSGEGDRD